MAKKSLLIVDEERILVDALAEHFGSTGLDVRGATSVGMAETILQAHDVAALIIDIALPGAPAVIREVRDRLPSVKVVVLTRRPHAAREGNLVVLDKNHGLPYLTRTLHALVGDDPDGDSVLIANGRPEIQARLSDYMEDQGYRVYAAGNGRDAVELARRIPEVKVALVDVHMPVQGGLDTLKALMQGDPHPEVIVTSAFPDAEIGQHALALGAFDYLTGPFDRDTIQSAVTAAFAHSEYRRAESLWGRILPHFLQPKAHRSAQ